ncbi:type II toxin-antitoxin system RelE/ParE family toxin [Escherichia coli]|uniref:type II toxin-antitoxin system RelE/ParE family toxin n=1 Tax=Escherichia coli TaxID=562 RepID=UPI0009412192|nr:type II toxin-antitoxin system RelE/ParE family toxin [Escherichia coli]
MIEWMRIADRTSMPIRDRIERNTHLAAGRGSFRDMSELFPELRMIHCEHHYVFCLPRGSAPALVVAIFHECMDLMTRLSERLNIESYG